jgi:hypothetical protein
MRLAAGVALASAGALVVTLALSSDVRAGGAATLAPDLVTLAIAPEDLLIETDGKRVFLRLTNEIANRGTGPLELFPSLASANCDGDGDAANDRDAAQRLFADSNLSGVYERGVDAVDSERAVGCMRYHPAHAHWHVLDFTSYELRREPRRARPRSKGKLVAASRKVGFCVVDSRRVFPGPGSPPEMGYPINPPGSIGCDAAATQGLSTGWADIYLFNVPGQELDVTGLHRGRYCLTSRADPRDLLSESDEDNNVRRVRLALRPSELSVVKIPGRCRV